MLLMLCKITFKLRANVFKHSINLEETATMEAITQFYSTQSLQKRYFPFIHFCDWLINLQSRHVVLNTANVTTL